jgi:hypothetical protein
MHATQTPPLTPEFFTQMQGKALDAFSVLSDMNQRMLQGLVSLSASAAREGLRACAELQSAAVEAARAAQPSLTAENLESLRQNPFSWYQGALLALVDGTQRAFRLVEANAQAVTRSAERIQSSADQASQELQQVLTASVDRLKTIYARN